MHVLRSEGSHGEGAEMKTIELTRDEFMDLVVYNLITIVRGDEIIRIYYDLAKEGGESNGSQYQRNNGGRIPDGE